GRVRAQRDVCRRAVQVGSEGAGADRRGEADRRGAGGADEVGEWSEGDDGGGAALGHAAPVQAFPSRGGARVARIRSRFSCAMTSIEISLGQAAMHSPWLVQAPKPAPSIASTMRSTRA